MKESQFVAVNGQQSRARSRISVKQNAALNGMKTLLFFLELIDDVNKYNTRFNGQ